MDFFSVGQRTVAFGTTLNRELLPLKVPPNRFGNELALRGAPNRGPGCYDNAEVITDQLYVLSLGEIKTLSLSTKKNQREWCLYNYLLYASILFALLDEFP